MATEHPESAGIDIPAIPTNTEDEFDDEESFIVLGKSPTSFFHEHGCEILQDALVSFNDNMLSMQSNKESLNTTVDEDLDKLENGIESVKIYAPVEVPASLAQNSIHSTDSSSDNVHTKVESLLEENNKLKGTIIQNNVAMKKQFDTIVKWQEDVQKVHELHKEKFTQTKEYIKELQNEICTLTESLKESLLKENELAKKLESSVSKNNMLQFDVDTTRTKIEQLQNEILENKKTTEKMRMDYEEQLGNVHKNAESLKHKYESLIKENGCSSEVLENTRQQLMNAQMHITQLEVKAADAQETINNQLLEISSLKQKIADQSHEQELEVLRVQLDLYKADYEAELAAKQSFQSANQQLMQDMQSLHGRNRQLIEELESYGLRDFVEVQRPSASAVVEENESPQPMRYSCPICMSSFRSTKFLQEHVDMCLNSGLAQ